MLIILLFILFLVLLRFWINHIAMLVILLFVRFLTIHLFIRLSIVVLLILDLLLVIFDLLLGRSCFYWQRLSFVHFSTFIITLYVIHNVAFVLLLIFNFDVLCIARATMRLMDYLYWSSLLGSGVWR